MLAKSLIVCASHRLADLPHLNPFSQEFQYFQPRPFFAVIWGLTPAIQIAYREMLPFCPTAWSRQYLLDPKLYAYLGKALQPLQVGQEGEKG